MKQAIFFGVALLLIGLVAFWDESFSTQVILAIFVGVATGIKISFALHKRKEQRSS